MYRLGGRHDTDCDYIEICPGRFEVLFCYLLIAQPSEWRAKDRRTELPAGRQDTSQSMRIKRCT
jgi:hypothetical protein